MFWQEGIDNYFQSLDALEIIPICRGKACGDRCYGDGVCNTAYNGTAVVCDFTPDMVLGCKIGEPFGMFCIIINNT